LASDTWSFRWRVLTTTAAFVWWTINGHLMNKSETNEEAKECPSSHEGVSCPASESIEKEAETFLQDLNVLVVDQDATIDPKKYRNHYETLLGALKLAHSRESGLVDQCQELRTQNVAGVSELQEASRSNKGMESQVEALQKDLDTVKSLLESANIREDRAKVTLSKLQEELERLTDLVDKGAIASARKDNEAKQLTSDVDEWKNQAASALEKINAMEIEQQKMTSQQKMASQMEQEQREKILSLKEHLSEKDAEVKRGNERRERIEKELEGVQSKLETKTKECIDTQYTIHMSQSKVTSLEKQLVDAKKATAMKEEELKEEVARTACTAASLHQQREKTTAVSQQLAEINLEAKKSAVEANRLVLENSQLQRQLQSERTSVLRHQQLVEDARASTRISNDELHLLKKELDKMRKKENQFNRDLLMLKRENAVASGRIQMSEDKVKKTGQDLQHNEQIIASLEKELAEANDSTAKQELVSRRLEGECEGLQHQLKDSKVTCQRLMDEMKIGENQSKDLSKVMGELQSQIEAQKKQHDTTRVDMNNTLKDLTDAQREIKELEQDKKSSQRLIDALRSEISTKDSALVKENYDYRREKAQKELYADEISRLKRSSAENDGTIRTHQSKVRQLGTAIRKLEDAASVQKREYEHVINERDILGTQLIRRNDELALLYEKIKILQSTQNRGELQYNSRLDDIRILKVKVRDLHRQLKISQGGQSGVDNVTRNLAIVQKELVRERLKVKALSEEMENPINVHRWRKLEGADPAAYEMVQKIQILQKRLLLKSEEVAKKTSVIQEQEKRQLEMENAMARQPGPDVAEQISSYQNDVRKKSKQMKAMASELNMHQTQVNEYKREIEKLATELHNFKRKYFEQKRREALAKEKELDLLSELAPSTLIKPFKDHSNASKTRFVGGGFAIK